MSETIIQLQPNAIAWHLGEEEYQRLRSIGMSWEHAELNVLTNVRRCTGLVECPKSLYGLFARNNGGNRW